MQSQFHSLAEKVVICPTAASEDLLVSDTGRIAAALSEQGYENVQFPLKTLRKIYPLLREGDTYTVTLVHKEDALVVTNVEAGDTSKQLYGIAMDYGSTSIVQQLVRLSDGEVLFETRELNDQRAFGMDILSRITYGLGGAAQKAELHSAAVQSMNRGFAALLNATGVKVTDCPIMVISGNTTMIHFLLELEAWTVFSSPYCPVTMQPGFFTGDELQLDFPGLVFIMPSASNYVGGDIVSGLLTLDMQQSDKIQVLFDVGTNGELVVGCRDWLIAGAGAAGPALEGYISQYGMVANPGAIDRVTIENGQLRWTTIGNKKPLGICGSGIIDLLAQMRLAGWISIAGQLNEGVSERIVKKRTPLGLEETVVVYAWADESGRGEDLYFSQTDINQYIETKAAAHTMVDCMLETAGITEEDIDHMYLSGAFCSHSDLEAAITIGMFPDLPRDKYAVLKNSSLEGARKLMLDRSRFNDIRWILDTIYCVQLASVPNFMIRMMGAKFLPHTDKHRYPTVFEELQRREAQ